MYFLPMVKLILLASYRQRTVSTPSHSSRLVTTHGDLRERWREREREGGECERKRGQSRERRRGGDITTAAAAAHTHTHTYTDHGEQT